MDIDAILNQIESLPDGGNISLSVETLKAVAAHVRTVQSSRDHFRTQQEATEKCKPVLTYRHNQIPKQIEILDAEFFKGRELESVDLYSIKPIQHIWPNPEYGELVKFNQQLVQDNSEYQRRYDAIDQQHPFITIEATKHRGWVITWNEGEPVICLLLFYRVIGVIVQELTCSNPEKVHAVSSSNRTRR